MTKNDYKVLLKTLIEACKNINTQVVDDEGDTCFLTNLFIPDSQSDSVIITSEGPIWLGCWLGFKPKINESDGFAMVPNFVSECMTELNPGFEFEDQYVYDPVNHKGDF
jgi:hypothetical protein